MTNIEFWTALSAIGGLAYCVITAVTLIFLGIQLREARRSTLAQFRSAPANCRTTIGGWVWKFLASKTIWRWQIPRDTK